MTKAPDAGGYSSGAWSTSAKEMPTMFSLPSRAAILPLIALVLALLGCGGGGGNAGANNPPPVDTRIVGTWTPKELQFNSDPPILCPGSIVQHGITRWCTSNTITFKMDGTGSESDGTVFTWTLSGDTLTISAPTAQTGTVKFTGDLATWAEPYPGTKDIAYLIFQRL
jgi:hypothetical protein